MMKHDSRITVRVRTMQGEMKQGDTVVLSYKIEYPVFTSPRYKTCLDRLNWRYEEEALAYRRTIATELYPAAKEQADFDEEHHYPVMVYQAIQTFTVTYSRGCIVSLYQDTYEFTGGAHGNTVRDAQTWNLRGCRRLGLNDLIGCGLDPKAVVLLEAKQQIQREPELYFEDYEKLLLENYDAKHFYAAPNGLVFYYPQYAIAPYASGIRTFLIPYGPCVHNPIQTCY